MSWPAPSGPLLPSAWWRVLRNAGGLDVGLRLTGGATPHVLLLLTANREETITALFDTLAAAATVTELKKPANAAEFDALTGDAISHEHMRVHHEGYHRGDQPLGCDFHLYAAWAGQGLPEGVAYQITLRSVRPGQEQERRVRKYLAWLDLEQPFTPTVRAMQEILSRRLLTPGWLGDEYLIFSNATLRDVWQERIRSQFSETTGRIGFREAPIESGDFSEWLTIGSHTARDCAEPLTLPVQAACTFTDDEIAWLSQQSLAPPAPGSENTTPDVFISYASGDFAHADAARQHLENAGWRCWIAPRDINNTGLPYTEAIPRAIRQVRAVVVLLSPSANLSVHIPRELDLALGRKLPVVPLRLINLLPSGQLDYLLRTCQWLDLFDRNHDDAMSELAVRLRGMGL